MFVGKAEPVVQASMTASQVGASETAFGLELLTRVCLPAPTANVVVSPASAAQALGLLDAGAAGKTQAAVSRLLHLPAWSRALVAALHDHSVAMRSLAQVAVSNHVFEQVGVRPSQRTLNDVRQAFGADLRAVDFAKEPLRATAAVNAAVNDDTHRLIPTLFDQPLDRRTQTVLTNAVYLRAKWQTSFKKAAQAPFHTAAGTTVGIPMMDGADVTAKLRRAGMWQSVTLPYQGRHLEAVALMPPAGAGRCPVPTAAEMLALTSGASNWSVGVMLPRLHLAKSMDLTGTLAGMGLPLTGDYTGLGASDTVISTVVQKTVVDVDERGTTAAAATGIAVAVSARALLTFDRPFLLLIQDSSTHTPLFLAYVAAPA